MEGTMDSRLVLSRPTPRPIAPRVVRSSQKPVNNPLVDVVDSGEISVQPIQPQFSKLTPIYKSGSVNTIADISQPRVKGIEFVQLPIAKTVKPSLQTPAPEATVNQTKPIELTSEPTNHKLEYLENNLDSVDLDLVVGIGNDSTDVTHVFESATESANYQPVNFIEQYFQRSPAPVTTKDHIKKIIPKVKHHLKKVNHKHVRRIGLASLLTAVIAFGGYVVADSFFINQEAKTVLAKDTSAVATAASPSLIETAPTDNSAATTVATPSPDAQSSQPALTPVGNSASRTIPADQPRYLIIKKLGIHAPIVSLGLTSSGAVDTPKNIWDAGWYNGSAKPGNDGAALLDGHSSATRGALLGNLDKLTVGDQLQVERGDGITLTYNVAYTTIVNRNNVDMASMMKPYGGASKGVNIITCIGRWIDSEKTLENRVLVYAVQL